MVGRDLRHRHQDVAQPAPVHARQTADRAEQVLRAELGHQRVRVRVIQRGEREGDVGHRLSEDAAEAEGDHGAELLVAAHADEELALVGHELLDEDAVLGSPRRPVDDAVVGGTRRRRVADVELNEAEVALVLDIGAERLEDRRPAEGLHGVGRALRAVHHRARGRGYRVHGEETLRRHLVERRPARVERAMDQLAAGDAHPTLPVAGVFRLSTPPVLRRTGAAGTAWPAL